MCIKIASATHAPVTKKEYERMVPFAQKTTIVDAVLNFLETNLPSYNEETGSLEFDIKAYYYCYALISLSDYRQDECEKQLWNTIHYFMEKDKDKCRIYCVI